MKTILGHLALFLILTFGGLAIGSFFTTDGVVSEWYQQLSKAPWTPPGWVFGAAWTFIMITFSLYMAYAMTQLNAKKELWILFGIQWILNVLWNPLFFKMHYTVLSLICIAALTFLMLLFFTKYVNRLGWKSLLLLPYIVWLFIATSLNLYVVLYN